jgi:hypothetical protein
MKNIIKIILLLTVTPLLWLIGKYADEYLDVRYPMNTYKEKRNG